MRNTEKRAREMMNVNRRCLTRKDKSKSKEDEKGGEEYNITIF